MNELHLYEVVLRNIDHNEARFVVACWLGPNKAIAVAVLANEAKSRPLRVFDIAVNDWA